MAGRLGNAAGDLTRRRNGSRSVTAATDVGVATATPITTLPVPPKLRVRVDQVAPHPLNPRGRVTGGVEELADSLKETGLIQPIVVAHRDVFARAHPDLLNQIPDTAVWVLVAGERRLLAAAQAGLTEIAADDGGDLLMTEGLDLEAMLVENIQRLDLTPLQEARTYAALLEPPHQLSQRTIAKRVGRNVSHISRRLTLLRLPTTAQAAVDAGQLPIADALSLAGGVDGHTDLALIAAAWILYQGGASSTDALHQALSHRKRADQVARNLADSRRRADDEGVQLIDPDDFGRDAEHKRIRDPEDIAAAREAGTLVAAPSDDGGLIYYDTAPEKPGPEAPSGPRGPGVAAEEVERRTRRAATTARQAAAAIAATKPPKTAEFADHLTAYTIRTANVDTLRLAARFLTVNGDPRDWQHQLLLSDAASVAERRRAAWAIVLAHAEVDAMSTHYQWGFDQAAYLATLASGGYEITDHDRARLAEADR